MTLQPNLHLCGRFLAIFDASNIFEVALIVIRKNWLVPRNQYGTLRMKIRVYFSNKVQYNVCHNMWLTLGQTKSLEKEDSQNKLCTLL